MKESSNAAFEPRRETRDRRRRRTAQRISATEVQEQPLLPCTRYQAAPGELGDAWRQPWPAQDPTEQTPAVIGRWARDLGAAVPGRLVASAKSWLSHAGVDRTVPILPWGAGQDVAKVSPLQASSSYLAHVRAAWDATHPDAPLAEQLVVLTVPASFDEGARAPTLQAAQLAGLPRVQLLEEPKAAFHDWLVLAYATVHNTGASAAVDVPVEFFDRRAGRIIGRTAIDVPASGAATAEVPWTPTSPDSQAIEVRVSPYVLDEVSYSNNSATREFVLGSPIGVAADGRAPKLRFAPPRPNPSVGGATFHFSLPSTAATSLEIFDILGRRVRSWQWTRLQAGDHSITWDGRGESGRRLMAGVYVSRVTFAGQQQQWKLVLRM